MRQEGLSSRGPAYTFYNILLHITFWFGWLSLVFVRINQTLLDIAGLVVRFPLFLNAKLS